jgi:hypothetical protein
MTGRGGPRRGAPGGGGNGDCSVVQWPLAPAVSERRPTLGTWSIRAMMGSTRRCHLGWGTISGGYPRRGLCGGESG